MPRTARAGGPNYLTHLAVSPDGVNAWVAAKKDNVLRGEFRDGQALTHETTVRGDGWSDRPRARPGTCRAASGFR